MRPEDRGAYEDEDGTFFTACDCCGGIGEVAPLPPPAGFFVNMSTLVTTTCPWCGFGWVHHWRRVGRKDDWHLNWSGVRSLVSREAFEVHLEARGSALGHIYCGFTVVGGYGWSPAAATQVTVAIGSDRLSIATVPLTSPITVGYEDLVSLEFIGGARSKGGGFLGGGFGVKGAAEGIVMAAILNSLTTKTEVNSVVRVSGTDGETLLHVADRMPAELRNWFAPAVNAVAANQRPASQPMPASVPQDDIVVRLERLVALRDAGNLTDDEFASAKAALLRGHRPDGAPDE